MNITRRTFASFLAAAPALSFSQSSPWSMQADPAVPQFLDALPCRTGLSFAAPGGRALVGQGSFTLAGGNWIPWPSSKLWRAWTATRPPNNSANIDATHSGTYWRAKCRTDSVDPIFALGGGTATNFARVLIRAADGTMRYVSQDGIALPGKTVSGAPGNFLQVFLPYSGCEVWIEGMGNTSFGGAYLRPGESLQPVAGQRRVIVLGDSVDAGVGTTLAADNCYAVGLGALGDARCSGIGGQGLITTAGGWTLMDRIGPDTAGAGLIGLAMGINDRSKPYGALLAAYTGCLQWLVTNRPGVPILAMEPTPTGRWPDPQMLTVCQAIRDAVAALASPMIRFVPVASVVQNAAQFYRADGQDLSHPSPQGHIGLGRIIAGQVAAVLA